MITAWRLAKRNHGADAFSGEGARRYGGRWNRKGTPVVYLADSLALAALEQFVHLGRSSTELHFVSFRVEIPEDLVEPLSRADLPSHWRSQPPTERTQELGTAWARRASAAVLRVPSALIPIEFNYMLNPLHPDARRIHPSRPAPFHFDPRMWK